MLRHSYASIFEYCAQTNRAYFSCQSSENGDSERTVERLTDKLRLVEDRISRLGGVVAALSRGVDSGLLLALATRGLGAEKVLYSHLSNSGR